MCQIADIPINLHFNPKKQGIDEDFLTDDLLYHRVSPVDREGLSNFIGDKVKPSFFRPQGTSCNWSRYSEPDSVLYDTKNGDHFFNTYKVFFTSIEDIISFTCQHPNLPKKYSLIVRHVPESCMYPHCEIHIMTDDAPEVYNHDIKLPNQVKSLIRNHLSNSFQAVSV